MSPTRPATSVSVELVAPPIALQFAPLASHASHWYAYLKAFPLHVPLLAVRVLGTCELPLIAGGVRFCGGVCPPPCPPDAVPVARTSVTAAAVSAVMWRLITVVHSDRGTGPITPKWGTSVN